jgi:glycine cleavage system aminomethyltransferase T
MLKDVRVWAFRMSYAGELGWEFTTTPDRAQRLWDVLWAAGRPLGIAACGRKALAALRIESGYRAWGLDVTTDHLPEAAGLDGAVTMGKPYFIGKDALLNQGDQPRRLVCLRLTEQDAVPTGGEPVVAPNGGAVGYVTTAEYGLAADAVIALAWVDRDQSSPGSALRVLYFGRDLSALVVREPVVPADRRSVFS